MLQCFVKQNAHVCNKPRKYLPYRESTNANVQSCPSIKKSKY